MDQDDNDELSDGSNDADFDPNNCKASSDEDADSHSEVEANSGDEGGTKKGKKRKKKSPSKSKRSKKSKVVNGTIRKRRKDSDEEESDDGKDEDFIIDPKVLEAEEKEKKKRLEEEEAELNKANAEEEKKRTDILWADFLISVKEENSTDSRRSSTNSSTTTETRTYDFAGEKFQVHERINSIPDPFDRQKPSTSASAAASNASFFSQFNIFHDTGRKVSSYLSNGNSLNDPSRAKQYIPPSRKGISSVLSSNPAAIGLNGKSGNLKTVLNAIRQNKSKKMGTLEKTKLDWQTFKKSEGIDEELKNHVQSKDSYLERQDFLQRTDVRQFELEKNMRARNRRNNP